MLPSPIITSSPHQLSTNAVTPSTPTFSSLLPNHYQQKFEYVLNLLFKYYLLCKPYVLKLLTILQWIFFLVLEKLTKLLSTIRKSKSLIFLFISQILFLLSFIVILRIFLVKPNFLPVEHIPTDDSFLYLQKSSTEKCHVTFLISAKPRLGLIGNEFVHLDFHLENLVKFKQRLFNPCFVIYNSKGKIYKDQVDRIVNKYLKQYPNIIALHSSYSYNMFMNAKVTPKQRSQSNNFFDMIKLFNHQLNSHQNGGNLNIFKLMDLQTPIIFIQDDYIICDGSISHLSLIFEKATHLEEQGKDWAGFRFSYGMSGFMIQGKDIPYLIEYFGKRSETKYSIQHLLDEFFDNTKKIHQDYFHDRYFYNYRFQLLKPNYHFNLEKSHFPQCFEPQSHLPIESCPNSLFFPCFETSQNGQLVEISEKEGRDSYIFNHDILTLASFPPTHQFSITDLKNVESLACEKGENCNACCRKLNAKCDVKFFEYINRCDEMQKFSPKCKCMYQKGLVVESSSPSFDENYCVLGSRVSKFNCQHSDPSTRRVCPCVKEIIEKYI